MTVPAQPKIYHIVHVDRLPSIIDDECLWCDAEVERRKPPGTPIGMTSIKQRRLSELTLDSYPNLHVGDCVPFYFCSRSIMLYLIRMGNHPELAYRGGQESIVHMEADLHTVIEWAENNNKRWAFTLTNAGSRFFEDRCDLEQLNEIDWTAVQSTQWRQCKDGKQAEFLIENSFSLELVSRIGVKSQRVFHRVHEALRDSVQKPLVEIKSDWYY